MPATKKKDSGLKKLPPLQIGVSEMANIRMIKMARPTCPTPTHPSEPGFDADTPNCQREFNGRIGWWDKCAERGHNPYFRIKEVVKEVPVWEKDEHGEEYLKETKTIRTEVEIPNISQVAFSERVNSGQGVTIARQRKGFKLLPEIGYDPVCEYRNCEAPVAINTIYGDYCGEQHARLIGADVEKIELEVHPDRAGERSKQLRQINLYA